MEPLGEDEIFSIFERIPNRKDKKSFSKVCKKFMKVASFHIRSLKNQFPDLLYDMLIASPKMGFFQCRKPLSNNHMKLIAESCPNIKILNLFHPPGPRHEVGKLEFDDVGLCAIAEACNHLVYVNLGGRLHFKDIGIGSLISDLGLEYLADGDLKHCLEKLYLNNCDRITDNGIVHLKKLVSLRTLDLSRCGANITDHGVVALCELPNLEILYLDFLTNITDISLLEIGRKCLEVSMLSLEGCNRITSVGLRAFSGHPRLARLFLFSCYKFSWEDIQTNVLTCPNMLYLGLSRRIKKLTPKAYYEDISINNHICHISYRPE
ncbi:Leucine-rich repeat, cysteine-containing subtype [Artemisia annua]|uniref:Leucine-rich repeat, cysteine-containing subtype n=1 Tax=Artemisia annua TaxID=35608 RepID=A0A2U1NS83_ARTAN|nr:Leucine-rich repeat, cysteine-containing subtype [Artemisia annua]